jgi:hypothetical protein
MSSGTYLLNRKKYGRPQAMLWSKNPGTLSNGLYIPNGYEVDANVPEDATENEIDQFIITSDHNRSALDFKPERIEQRERMINGRMRSYYTTDKMTISTGWDAIPSRAFKQKPNWGSDLAEAYLFDVTGDGTEITYVLNDTISPFAEGDIISVSGTTITGFNAKNAEILSVGTMTDEFDIDHATIVIAGTANGTFDPDNGGLMTYANAGISSITDNFQYQYTVDGGAGGLDLLEWYESNPGPFWVFLAYDKFTNFGRETSDYNFLNQYNEVIEMYITDFSYTVEKRGGIYDMWNVSISLEEV